MAALIQLRSVRREFGDQVALSGVNLAFERGEFACLVGHSGAGKTTLLSVINRQLRPSSGEVWVDGVAAHDLPPQRLPVLRRKVATVFQDHKLLPELTAVENVAFAVRLTDLGATDAEVREKAVQALAAVGMGKRAGAFPRELSYGQCQRVALARAIVNRPAVLLADEPTGNLDETTAESIVELLVRIGRRGTAVLLATHNLEIVRRLQRRVVTLSHGVVIEDRPAGAAPVLRLRTARP